MLTPWICLSLCLALGDDPASTMAVEADIASIGPPPGVVAGLIGRYESDLRSVTRSAPPAGSAAREALLRRLDASWLKAIETVDFDKLDVADRVDYTLLKNRLAHQLRQLDLDARERAEVEPLVPFAGLVLDLDAARRRMDRPDGKEVAGKLVDLAKQVAAARKAVDRGLTTKGEEGPTVTKAVGNRGVRAVAGLRATLGEFTTFREGYDPIFTWWTAEPAREAEKALQGYEAFLREKVVGLKADDKTTIVGNPIGREAILADLESAMVPYTPEELIALAEKEFAWCDAEARRASSDLGFGGDWKPALEKVKTLHVGPGEQPEMIKGLALEAIRFVEENGLVTVPPLARDSWRMEMMTPEQQLVNPFFTGGEVISVSYPTSGMTHEQKLMSMRGNNVHFSRATVHHELIPGHHLQIFMNARHRPYRRAFSTPFSIEGWALYWEMILWDKGFPKSAEDRVGFLFWRMHRCARIIFSLRFHLGEMTPAQCIDFLVDRVGHERENATAEVRRSFNGSYGPLYQCAYMLGAMQLRALRKELVESGTMPERAFHDAILRENAIPIEMVRASLIQQRPPRDFKTSWKFAGEHPGKD